MQSELTWLHLSDLHFCEAKTGWDSARVISTLTNDLRRMHKEYGLQPDFIFFTGDLAYGELGQSPGERITDQFNGAAIFLERVRSAFERIVPAENVFVVPGNHDVNRDYVTEDQTKWLDDQIGTERVTDLIQRKALQWKRYVERLRNYAVFLAEHGYTHLLQDPDRLIYSITRETNGRVVNIVGLNSAWSCGRDGEKAKLWMGARWQVGHLTGSMPPADISIALMHHPSNWLGEYEDPIFLREIEREFQFSLHGHEHQEWVTIVPSHVRIAAGACYDRSDKPNGYNFVRVNFETGDGEVWLRKYHSPGGDWIPDIIPRKTNNDGRWPLSQVTDRARPALLAMGPDASQESDITVPIPITRGRPFRRYGPDLRPVVDAWVGRHDELSALNGVDSGVVVVTGIGGQGKSALVSKFLETWLDDHRNVFWDWRDCREEGERFLTQLIAMIEHMTEGAIGPDYFTGADTKAIVRYMFEIVGDRRGVVVLDNVDYYVDEAEQTFSLGVGIFVQEALRTSHKLLVILTCRPRISYGDPRFLEIPLNGIKSNEAHQLFSLRRVKLNDLRKPEVDEIWSLTEGHPLWLNLISVQIARNPQVMPIILDELRKGTDDRAKSMFKALWRGLNNRHQAILRSMAELSYPETEESIRQFVGNLVKSPNQYKRAFEHVRTLNLIVERGFISRGKTYDLHPLVRSFIRTEYPTQQERLPFIRPILLVLAAFIQGLEGPTHNAALEDLQRWTTKAELEIAADDDTSALETLAKTEDQLVARGFHEEFLRVAQVLLARVNWSSVETQDSPQFHSIVKNLIKTLAEHDRAKEARIYLRKYEEAAGTRTVARLRYLNTAGYVEWILGNYDQAIAIGREGVAVKAQSGIDTEEDASHSLALALRDHGELDEALKIFTDGRQLRDILAEDHLQSGKSGPFYGNIGRCLQLKNELDDALTCYMKSAELLYKESSAGDILNRGYAALWIGEILASKNDSKSGYAFLRSAIYIWAKRSPLLVGEPMKRLAFIRDQIDEQWASMSNSAVDKYCRNWISNWSKVNRRK